MHLLLFLLLHLLLILLPLLEGKYKQRCVSTLFYGQWLQFNWMVIEWRYNVGKLFTRKSGEEINA